MLADTTYGRDDCARLKCQSATACSSERAVARAKPTTWSASRSSRPRTTPSSSAPAASNTRSDVSTATPSGGPAAQCVRHRPQGRERGGARPHRRRPRCSRLRGLEVGPIGVPEVLGMVEGVLDEPADGAVVGRAGDDHAVGLGERLDQRPRPHAARPRRVHRQIEVGAGEQERPCSERGRGVQRRAQHPLGGGPLRHGPAEADDQRRAHQLSDGSSPSAAMPTTS